MDALPRVRWLASLPLVVHERLASDCEVPCWEHPMSSASLGRWLVYAAIRADEPAYALYRELLQHRWSASLALAPVFWWCGYNRIPRTARGHYQSGLVLHGFLQALLNLGEGWSYPQSGNALFAPVLVQQVRESLPRLSESSRWRYALLPCRPKEFRVVAEGALATLLPNASHAVGITVGSLAYTLHALARSSLIPFRFSMFHLTHVLLSTASQSSRSQPEQNIASALRSLILYGVYPRMRRDEYCEYVLDAVTDAVADYLSAYEPFAVESRVRTVFERFAMPTASGAARNSEVFSYWESYFRPEEWVRWWERYRSRDSGG